MGRRVLVFFEPFVVEVLASSLADRTKKRHLDNLWLLGGEIVRTVSIHEQYNEEIEAITRASVDEEGGPWCKHLHTDEEVRTFNATCRKLAKHFARVK